MTTEVEDSFDDTGVMLFDLHEDKESSEEIIVITNKFDTVFVVICYYLLIRSN